MTRRSGQPAFGDTDDCVAKLARYQASLRTALALEVATDGARME
jgi:hypothetical protein